MKKKVLNKSTKKYIIGYFDILGYKNIIKEKTYKESALILIFDFIYSMIKKTEKAFFGKMKIYSFSDNFLMCAEYKSKVDYYYNIKTMVSFMELIQTRILGYFGFLIRGCILDGNLYLGDNFIYGKGMVDAYNLENNIAKYPRIILDRKMMIKLYNMIKNSLSSFRNDRNEFNEKLTLLNMFEYYERYHLGILLKESKISKLWYRIETENRNWISIQKDFDSQYYVDYFQFLDYLNRTCRKKEAQMLFYRSVVSICTNMEDINDANVLDKYLWSCKYINKYLVKFGYKKITEEMLHEITGLDFNKFDVTINFDE